MHDLRAAPRWSKTAVVVVLVVFGLVLVVSIFGLWAFTSDREARRRKLREDARNHAQDLMIGVQDAVGRRFDGLLERASKVDGPERLQGIRSSPPHGALIREIFAFDPDGAVRWIDRAYRIYDSPKNIARQSEWQHTARDRAEMMLAEATERAKRDGARGALEAWRDLVQGFPLLLYTTEGDPEPTSDGVRFAVEMLRCAVNALAEVPDREPGPALSAALRDALLLAAEVETLNRSRPGLKQPYSDYKLRELQRVGEQLLGRLPDALRSSLGWEVRRYREYRDFVADPMNKARLDAAISKVPNPEREGRHVIFEDPELLGVLPSATQGTLVARLDLQETERLIREKLDADAFRQLGMRARLFRLAEAPVLDGADGPEGSLTLIDRPYALPFRLAFFRVGEPQGDPGGLTDLLFWVVIALAGAGLATGGYVLVRLLTRQIRLAQLKADFVSNLSHELKTPITSIALFTEMLDDGKITKDEDQAEAFSVLNQESQRLQRIVARMIDVARGEARRTPYDLQLGDFNGPVLEAATRFRRIVTEPGMDLQVSLFPEPLPIRLDEQAMDDVVTNLLSNAWKYKRGERCRIAVRTARRGRYAELVVTDDGLGIPRSERRRVFEMFYRAEQYLTHPVAGTGLGLALVRSVVRGHRGTIKIESGEGGRGSAFRLRFPLDLQGVAAEEKAVWAGSPPDSDPGALGHGKVGGGTADDRPADGRSADSDEPARTRATHPGAQS